MERTAGEPPSIVLLRDWMEEVEIAAEGALRDGGPGLDGLDSELRETDDLLEDAGFPDSQLLLATPSLRYSEQKVTESMLVSDLSALRSNTRDWGWEAF